MTHKQPCGREGGFRERYTLGGKPRVLMKACFEESSKEEKEKLG